MRMCMHTSKHKAQDPPLFVYSLYSPIKFFTYFIDPSSARLEVLVWFFFPAKSLST